MVFSHYWCQITHYIEDLIQFNNLLSASNCVRQLEYGSEKDGILTPQDVIIQLEMQTTKGTILVKFYFGHL